MPATWKWLAGIFGSCVLCLTFTCRTEIHENKNLTRDRSLNSASAFVDLKQKIGVVYNSIINMDLWMLYIAKSKLIMKLTDNIYIQPPFMLVLIKIEELYLTFAKKASAFNCRQGQLSLTLSHTYGLQTSKSERAKTHYATHMLINSKSSFDQYIECHPKNLWFRLRGLMG